MDTTERIRRLEDLLSKWVDDFEGRTGLGIEDAIASAARTGRDDVAQMWDESRELLAEREAPKVPVNDGRTVARGTPHSLSPYR